MSKYVLQFYDILVLISKLEDLCLIITPSFSPPRAPLFFVFFFFFIIPVLLLVISFTQLGNFLFPAFTPARVFDQPPVHLETEYQAAGTKSSSRSYT